jgi:hypothetical protein
MISVIYSSFADKNNEASVAADHTTKREAVPESSRAVPEVSRAAPCGL